MVGSIVFFIGVAGLLLTLVLTFAVDVSANVSRWWRTNTAASADAFVADMSMTGVGVLIPRGFDLTVGTIVSIEICGASGEAIIRTARVVDAAWAHYGLEYCPLGDDFHEVVSGLVAATHRNFDWQWTIAR